MILLLLCKYLWFYLFKTATEIRHFSETPKTVMQLIATKLVLLACEELTHLKRCISMPQSGYLNNNTRDFPGSSVFGTLCFHHQGCRFGPWSEN